MKYTNLNNMPLSLSVWLAHDSYDYSTEENTISVTTLIKPLRELILSFQNKDLESVADLSSQMASSKGTAVHDSIEKAWLSPALNEILNDLGYPDSAIQRVKINPSALSPGDVPIYLEQRFTRKVGKYTVSGKVDFIENGTIEDFKNVKVYSYTHGSNDEQYRQQLSIYRWLRPDIITNDHAYIRYMFSDWAVIMTYRDTNYPKSDTLSKKFILMSLEETEFFITGILEQLDYYLVNPEEEPPYCTKEELWQKDPVWKYYKDPTKTTRSTKNYSSSYEADERLAKDNHMGIIKFVPGEVVRCKYCKVREICSQAQDLIASGLLTL